MLTLPRDGMVHLDSAFSVPETLRRIEEVLVAHGASIMARIDHAAGAVSVGLTMLPAVLLIFGNPRSGTPLMVAAPTLALDLPLKVLVWQDAEEIVRVSYNTPEYLQERHDVPRSLLPNITGPFLLIKSVLAN